MTIWRYEIKHGPEGETDFAWIYKGDIFVATMRTHHAVEIVKALSASPAGVVKLMEAVRSAGLKARDELLERMADGGTVDNDLADYMERIVDACVNSARIMSAIEPAGVGVETPPPSSHVLVPKSAIDWLLGEGPDVNGEHFGDNIPERAQRYWWRSHFRTLIADGPSQNLRGIETAPKDGTWFIAYQNDEPFPCDWRTEEQDEGPPREGWFDFFNRSFEDPTHWLPVYGSTTEGQDNG